MYVPSFSPSLASFLSSLVEQAQPLLFDLAQYTLLLHGQMLLQAGLALQELVMSLPNILVVCSMFLLCRSLFLSPAFWLVWAQEALSVEVDEMVWFVCDPDLCFP
jgi:hypothetical protein